MPENNIQLSHDELSSLHKEIDLIQNCITRMAQNSFMIRGWAISIVVITWAIIGIVESWGSIALILLLLPILMFWYLDAFFLMTERRYRDMYKSILEKRLKDKNFENMYDLNPNNFKNGFMDLPKCMISKTLWPFYLSLIVVVVVAITLQFLLCI